MEIICWKIYAILEIDDDDSTHYFVVVRLYAITVGTLNHFSSSEYLRTKHAQHFIVDQKS